MFFDPFSIFMHFEQSWQLTFHFNTWELELFQLEHLLPTLCDHINHNAQAITHSSFEINFTSTLLQPVWPRFLSNPKNKSFCIKITTMCLCHRAPYACLCYGLHHEPIESWPYMIHVSGMLDFNITIRPLSIRL